MSFTVDKMIDIPKKFLTSEQRKQTWENAREIVNAVEKVLPISSAYLSGSYTSKKRRPADLDFVILLKTKKVKWDSKWSLDFIIAPDNKHGELVLQDVDKWIKQKYGKKSSGIIRLK